MGGPYLAGFCLKLRFYNKTQQRSCWSKKNNDFQLKTYVFCLILHVFHCKKYRFHVELLWFRTKSSWTMARAQGSGLRAQGWLLMGQWQWVKASWPEVSQQKSGGKSQSSWPHGFFSRPWILNLNCKNIAICLWISWNWRNCIFKWQSPTCHDERCI